SLQRPQVILPEDQDFVKHLAQAAEHAMLTMEQKVQCRRPGSIGFRGDFLDGG
ncbi:unnamed protein product, partial [Durusdinium trenchii]